jgi:hypothetical protein
LAQQHTHVVEGVFVICQHLKLHGLFGMQPGILLCQSPAGSNHVEKSI